MLQLEPPTVIKYKYVTHLLVETGYFADVTEEYTLAV